jgi:tRNA (guanine-N7-)-methyltransferase
MTVPISGSIDSMPADLHLDYHATSFSQGRMDFTWEELSAAERQQASRDWEAGKGLIGGNPRQRPDAHVLPAWGRHLPFFRILALDDANAENGAFLRALLASGAALEIEIGYGRGDFLLDRAQRHPAALFIGYETNTGATRRMLARVAKLTGAQRQPGDPITHNLWLSDDDARYSIPRLIPDGRVDVLHILFPDPWWKNQHRLKRLFSPPFVDLAAAKLRSGALLHFKSDVAEYGELVCYLLESHPLFLPHNPDLAAQIGKSAMTHREAWCINNHKPVYAYYFLRR